MPAALPFRRPDDGSCLFVTIEGTKRTAHGWRTWRQEVPEKFLGQPQVLCRALENSLGATGIVWVGQSGNLARFLTSLKASPRILKSAVSTATLRKKPRPVGFSVWQ